MSRTPGHDSLEGCPFSAWGGEGVGRGGKGVGEKSQAHLAITPWKAANSPLSQFPLIPSPVLGGEERGEGGQAHLAMTPWKAANSPLSPFLSAHFRSSALSLIVSMRAFRSASYCFRTA
jgi:hypothetical protein